MDINIEVVSKEEELEFPYVVEYKEVTLLVTGENYDRYVAYNLKDMSDYTAFAKGDNVTKRYKILEANYKLQEV